MYTIKILSTYSATNRYMQKGDMLLIIPCPVRNFTERLLATCEGTVNIHAFKVIL
jgi:hypothetical protein